MLDAFERAMDNRGHSYEEYLDYSSEVFTADRVNELCDRCPPFYISFAWTAYLSGDAETFEKYMDSLYENLVDLLVEYPRFGELTVMMLVLDYRASFAERIEQAELLPPIETESSGLKSSSMSLQMPFLHRSSRDYCELSDTNLYDGLKKTYGKLLKSHHQRKLLKRRINNVKI